LHDNLEHTVPTDSLYKTIPTYVPQYCASFCCTHELPRNTVYQSSLFIYTHLFYMEQTTTYFSTLLHDVQNSRN